MCGIYRNYYFLFQNTTLEKYQNKVDKSHKAMKLNKHTAVENTTGLHKIIDRTTALHVFLLLKDFPKQQSTFYSDKSIVPKTHLGK